MTELFHPYIHIGKHFSRRTTKMANEYHAHKEDTVFIKDFCEDTGGLPEQQHVWKAFMSTLKHYKHFHGSQLMRLKQQMVDKSYPNNNSNRVRTLMWSCDHSVHMCSGLGAQFRNILSAFILSMMTQRVFFINLGKIEKKTMLIETNEIDWSSSNESLGMHKYSDFQVPHVNCTCRDYAKLQYLLKSRMPHITLSLSVGSIMHCINDPWVGKGLNALGLSSPARKENFIDLLSGVVWRFLFTLPGNLVNIVKQRELSLGLRNRRYISVHIRTGFLGSTFEEKKNTTVKKIQKDKMSWDSVLKCSLKLANKLVGTNSPIFLATDSPLVKEWTLKRYSKRVRTLPIEIIHSDKPKTWKQGSKSAFMDMWTDILLLAKGKVLVLSHSGFSRLALQLCSKHSAGC